MRERQSFLRRGFGLAAGAVPVALAGYTVNRLGANSDQTILAMSLVAAFICFADLGRNFLSSRRNNDNSPHPA